MKLIIRISDMMRPPLYWLFNKLKNVIRATKSYPVIFNANGVEVSIYSKRALLIYIVKPFLVKDDDPSFFAHQQSKQCKQIAALLGELGYIVDVVDIRDMKSKPSENYDLYISNRVYGVPIKKNTIRIYFATTSCHKTHNENLRKRHEYLRQRRGCWIQPRRVYSESMPYIEKSDAIVGFGNEFIMKTWKDTFKIPVYPFNNYGFKETPSFPDSKDFAKARKNFLFFSSGSQMQKGLDLLLEIFPKHPDLQLYICSGFKKELDFCNCYRKELYETANIHPLGRIRVNGSEYNDLVRICAFVLAPTCSEGQPGSVVQCMHSGLIPLVTREAGIDTEDFGITFADDSLEEIERVILKVSEQPETWHREHSMRTREISEQKYCEDAFVNRWRYILSEILNSAGDGGNS